jgi:hypothetical protein
MIPAGRRRFVRLGLGDTFPIAVRLRFVSNSANTSDMSRKHSPAAMMLFDRLLGTPSSSFCLVGDA